MNSNYVEAIKAMSDTGLVSEVRQLGDAPCRAVCQELIERIIQRNGTITELREQLERERAISTKSRKMGEYYTTKIRKNVRKDIADEYLLKAYVEEGQSLYKICKDNGWNVMTIKNRLKRLGVYRDSPKKSGGVEE